MITYKNNKTQLTVATTRAIITPDINTTIGLEEIPGKIFHVDRIEQDGDDATVYLTDLTEVAPQHKAYFEKEVKRAFDKANRPADTA